MSYDFCKAEWLGKDGKEHCCVAPEGHYGTCECDCGYRQRVANQIATAKLKPFYKRQKATPEEPTDAQ